MVLPAQNATTIPRRQMKTIFGPILSLTASAAATVLTGCDTGLGGGEDVGRRNDLQAMEYSEKAWGLDQTDAVIAANLSVAYHHMARHKDRDRMYEEARRLGYASLDRLDGMFSGELTM